MSGLMEQFSRCVEAFDTSRDLYNALQKVAIDYRFSMRILRSCQMKKTIVICCDRAGSHVSTATTRTTKTKKTGCLFRVFGKRGDDGQWRFVRAEGVHNHPMSEDIRVHARAREMTGDQTDLRQRLETAGVKPGTQIQVLRTEFADFRGIQKDMYNKKQAHKKKILAGRTPIQALFDLVRERRYQFEFKTGENGRISHLLLAHPESVALLQRFHSVLQFDCTYKTNLFKFPLLVCTGLTAAYKSFLGCMIFMIKEETEDYVWALRGVRRLLQDTNDPEVVVSDNEAALLRAESDVFPLAHQVMCRWHVNQNILKKCKRHFSDGARWEQIQARWNDLCKSRSAEAFEDSWASLKNEFDDIPVVVSYLNSTWIKHKERIADAWVGKRLHLGCSTTSRAESSNAFIKRFLSSSGGDLLTVFQELDLAINHQVSELAKTHADDSFKRYFFTNESIYTDVAGKVSNYALLRAFNHRQTRIGTECSGHFSTTMGIPCAHKQNERNQNNQKLSLSDFHEQWHVKGPSDNLAITNLAMEPTPEDLISTLRAQYDAAPPHKKLELIEQVRIIINSDTSSTILEPLPVRVKGRPKGATAKLHSTKRDPSGFEYVFGSKQLQRQCSKCKLFGHNIRTCSTKTSL